MTPMEHFFFAGFLAALALASLLHLVALLRAWKRGDAGVLQRLAFWLGVVGLSLVVGFLAARWVHTGQAPLQSKFETFVINVLGMVIGYVIIWKSQRMGSRTGGAAVFSNGIGLLTLGVAFLFGWLAYSHQDWEAMYRPPALKSFWMIPHVSTLIFGYGALFVAFCGAVGTIVARGITGRSGVGGIDWDAFLHRTMAIGFPFLTAGIFMGSVWGQEAWSTYWGWDIKETWSLITWLVFLIYFHLRYQEEFRGAGSAWVIVLGSGAIILTWLGMSLLPDSVSSLHVYN